MPPTPIRNVPFVSSHDELDRLTTRVANGQHTLVVGDSGYGKSTAVHAAAAALGREVVTVIGGSHLTFGDLVGRYHLGPAGSFFREGPLTRALRRAADPRHAVVFFLDELGAVPEDVLVSLYSLLDHRRALFVPAFDEPIVAPAGFVFVGATTPRAGRMHAGLPLAFLSRLHILEVRPLDEQREIDLVVERTGIDRLPARALVQCARHTRNSAESNLPEGASTRLVLQAARDYLLGDPIETVLDANFVLPLTDVRSLQARLRHTLMLQWTLGLRDLEPPPAPSTLDDADLDLDEELS